jgi:predicted amidophosphoribosyltransferase
VARGRQCFSFFFFTVTFDQEIPSAGVCGLLLLNRPKLDELILAPVFTRLFHRSFAEGHVPKLWRSSTIVPVPKKQDASQLNDFRPVALTSVPMKCAERLVLKHLRAETATHQDPLQFAYSQGRNTQDAILTLLHSL